MLAPWKQLSTVRGTPGKGNSLSNGAEVETAWGTSRDLHTVHPASEGSRKTQKLGYKGIQSSEVPACSCVCNKESLHVFVEECVGRTVFLCREGESLAGRLTGRLLSVWGENIQGKIRPQ